MEKPNAETLAWFQRNVPDDPRALPGQMFGQTCAYVNGHLFFGTCAQSVIVRVGEARAAVLVAEGLPYFEPMAGRAWKDYVQIVPNTVSDADLRAMAVEALETTFALPPKGEKPPRKPDR